MESSVILEEEIDENYEPTENEILEYGLWLGLTLPEDDDLLHIAKEGLKAPLPSQWKPCKTREGDIYYFNFETGASDWEHPCDGHYKQLVKEAKQLKAKRGQESAKKKKNTSNSDFIEKSNKMKPLKRSPLGKISETGEFANRKQELEEAFAEEIDQMRHDYDDKKKELKKKTDEELNKFKSDAEKEQKAEEQRVHLEYSQKIETKKETIRLEIQKSEKERIAKENRDAIDKLEAVKNNCTNDFKEQKQKLTHRLKSESSEEIKKIEMLLSSEIETLLSELDLHKSKAERELNEQNEVTNRYNKKLERFREDSEDQLKREVKKLEKEFE